MRKKRDANLLTAEGIFDLMFTQIEIVELEIAFELLQNLRQLFNERRHIYSGFVAGSSEILHMVFRHK